MGARHDEDAARVCVIDLHLHSCHVEAWASDGKYVFFTAPCSTGSGESFTCQQIDSKQTAKSFGGRHKMQELPGYPLKVCFLKHQTSSYLGAVWIPE